VNQAQFLKRCPAVWHVGPVGSWEGIKLFGFRTAEQLINRAEGLSDEEREALLTQPRAEKVKLMIEGHEVVLRDQEALTRRKEVDPAAVDGLLVADWIRALNKRVYCYTDPIAMKKAVDKYIALEGGQEVITFSPLRLYDLHRHQLELSSQNTGAIARTAGVQKHLKTFQPVGLFPDKRPAELTVLDGIDDLATVAFAERYDNEGNRAKLPR
jgi:hypothetical protein